MEIVRLMLLNLLILMENGYGSKLQPSSCESRNQLEEVFVSGNEPILGSKPEKTIKSVHRQVIGNTCTDKHTS